ncbi:N-acetyltransferase [uncultured Pseudodesulfovibrio sp.]|uniref:GNAT family N-acetyltransferase n=1 Tax=uncultured Pseudodesulfovibrio sp. TaxID=2035858 RepID=UPI0029C70728|nr:N-acetyltransferase [uncultured Pseudodesulfovibrio sp.]
MKIRHERFSDKETISSIHYAAFKNHPQYAQGAEPTEHLVVEHLRAANAMTLSLVAEKNSELLGHIAFSVAPIGYLTGGWHLLGPIGILPQHQRKGIGSKLICESIIIMQAHHSSGIVLVGDPVFYERFGFRNYEGLNYPGVPRENVMALPLTGNGYVPKGDIIAHEAFEE